MLCPEVFARKEKIPPEGTGAQALDELQALPAEDKHRRSLMRLRHKKRA